MGSAADLSLYFGEIVRESFSKFLYAYSRDDLRRDYVSLQQEEGTSGFYSRRRTLVKRLRACGIDCADQESMESLRQKVEQAPERDELIRRLLLELGRIWQEFPSPADHMEHTVRKLGDPDLWDPSVRLTILRHFLRYGPENGSAIRRLAQAKYGDEVPEKVDTERLVRLLRDDIFDILDKPLSDTDKDKYEMLICADDLARGRFRQQGKAKMVLYRFAFAFGMTASVPGREPVPDRDRDITVRLFEDYYQNNILRYLVGHGNSAGGRKSNGAEAEPVGEGINPKNFAEAIYIYHLRKDGLSRLQRYDMATKMIGRCMAIAAARGGTQADPDLELSKDYWDRLMDGVWDLEPADLERFICDHYEIPKSASGKSRIAVAWECRTALVEYVKILCGLSFADGFLGKKIDEGIVGGGIDRYLEEKGVQISPELYKLLQQMDRCLSLELPEPQTIRAALLDDQGDPELGQWVLLPCVYMQALGKLLKWVLGQPASFSALRREVKASREASEDAGYRALADQLMDRLAECTTLCQRICARVQADDSLLDGLWTEYQGGLLDMKAPLIWWPAVSKPLDLSYQLAAGCADTLVEAVEVCSALQACRKEMAKIVRKMANCVPESDELGDRCLKTVEACAAARAAKVLPKAAPFLEALTQTLERFGEGGPSLAKIPPVSKPVKIDLKKLLKDQRDPVTRLHRVSRTQMIAMACLSYMDESGGERRSMPDMLQDLKHSIDKTLIRCRFQPISEKNLFDMLIVFELYLGLTLGQS